jgi:hypothetical protein
MTNNNRHYTTHCRHLRIFPWRFIELSSSIYNSAETNAISATSALFFVLMVTSPSSGQQTTESLSQAEGGPHHPHVLGPGEEPGTPVTALAPDT